MPAQASVAPALFPTTTAGDTEIKPIVLVTFLSGKSERVGLVPLKLRSLYNEYAEEYQNVLRIRNTLKNPYIFWYQGSREQLEKELSECLAQQEELCRQFWDQMELLGMQNLDRTSTYVQKDWSLHVLKR